MATMASFHAAARISSRRLLSTTKTPFFKPSLVDTRPGEKGPSGRAAEAGCKVAVFGASGFLGRYVCSELGTFIQKNKVSIENCACFELDNLPCADPTLNYAMSFHPGNTLNNIH